MTGALTGTTFASSTRISLACLHFEVLFHRGRELKPLVMAYKLKFAKFVDQR
jgi:hypothetical protein